MFYVRQGQFAPNFDAFYAGFQVQYSNGLTVSVQFGSENYCDNKCTKYKVSHQTSCANAEVAVMNAADEFVTGYPYCSDYDQVTAHVTPDQLLEIMNWAKNQNPAKVKLKLSVGEDK